MESAIDKHLICPRTLSRRVADDYQPPFPMYVARAAEDLNQVVMGYFGVQYSGADKRAAALAALRRIVADFGMQDAPNNGDLPQHPDDQGYENLLAGGYGREPAA